ncbi:DNA/RNA nuclease SfsA [Candidatus Viridilinea mediisalina]|uniref:Sugar fermentation stimulation protein homolog n=1 Tax=Candidatus Viridilinea mediisalina TaxID=2024553 RepID=A0A2A6RLG0_9CHLR|nr:DNA/RNA nuclease SfsA [Candidatus Viridilinea mediisalina]PDW03680.1 DNA/RNA nuclease SfsA [Candidatus Viridilinea mediisalina]
MIIRVPLIASGPLTEATFVARPNQLLVEARINERLVRAHLADRGRLLDLLVPGARLILAPRDELGRKTMFQVVGVYSGAELVSLDTQLPNRLVVAALTHGALPQFARYHRMQREATIGNHRFDFRLGEGLHTCILEVKSVGKVVESLAYFPDAPSERARKHLELLAQMARSGQRCAVVFIIQRHAAQALVPDEDVDPAFARAMRQALASGVEMYAYLCPLTLEGITLGAPVPIYTSPAALPQSKWGE